jgi:hypothetical protein
VRTLTVNQLLKACEKHSFILAREYKTNIVHGINCGVINLEKVEHSTLNRGCEETNYISFKPCDFHEYISNKIAFLTPNK